MTRMKCYDKYHHYLYEYFLGPSDLEMLIEKDEIFELNYNYKFVLKNNIEALYFELMYRYDSVPILRNDTFQKDFIMTLRRLEHKLKSIIFVDDCINWDNPQLTDFVRSHFSISTSKSNRTPFMDFIDDGGVNADSQEKNESNEYYLSIFHLQQRLKNLKWNDIFALFVQDFQHLFYKTIPYCCDEVEEEENA